MQQLWAIGPTVFSQEKNEASCGLMATSACIIIVIYVSHSLHTACKDISSVEGPCKKQVKCSFSKMQSFPFPQTVAHHPMQSISFASGGDPVSYCPFSSASNAADS